MSEKLPSAAQNPNGLHKRYEVKKLVGETDPNAVYFVLRLDNGGDDPAHVEACREAAFEYCEHILSRSDHDRSDCDHLSQMARELAELCNKFEREASR